MNELIKRYPELEVCKKDIKDALDLMINTYKNGGKILVCGNGGSAADSENIVGELMKGFMCKRTVTDERIPEGLAKNLQGALPAISLVSQCGVLSAFINDVAPDMMYAQLVYGYGNEKDLLICLSTSGNSKNCVNAAKVAKCIGVNVLSLTGAKESLLSEFSECTIRVPETETFKVQEYHLPVYHYLCAATENYFFKG
mgnify:CR=1 FL=1